MNEPPIITTVHARLGEYRTMLLALIATWSKRLVRTKTMRPTTREQVLFFTRLARYLEAGIPLRDALAVFEGESSTNSRAVRHQRMVSVISQSVLQGRTVAGSLAIAGRFDSFSLSLVRIGEETGRLPETLLEAARLLKRRAAARRALSSALIYPAIIVCGTIAITTFLALYAFPKLLPIFNGFHQKLPLPTRLLIGFVKAIHSFGVYIAFGTMLLVIGGGIAFRHERVRAYFERLLLRLPFVHPLMRSYSLSAAGSILATLLESGISILPACAILAETAPYRAYRAAWRASEVRTKEGMALSACISHFPTLFPSEAIQLIALGERTGSLARHVRLLAENEEEALLERAKLIGTLLEPALMIGMGLLVGFIALAIITPIYGITQNLTTR